MLNDRRVPSELVISPCIYAHRIYRQVPWIGKMLTLKPLIYLQYSNSLRWECNRGFLSISEFQDCLVPCIIPAKQTFTLLALQALLETIYRLCQVCCLRPKIGQRFTSWQIWQIWQISAAGCINGQDQETWVIYFGGTGNRETISKFPAGAESRETSLVGWHWRKTFSIIGRPFFLDMSELSTISSTNCVMCHNGGLSYPAYQLWPISVVCMLLVTPGFLLAYDRLNLSW